MVRMLIFYTWLVAAAQAGVLYSGSGESRVHRSDDGLGSYSFGYDETHSTGGTFRQERGNAFGNKIGSYGLRTIDGRYRVVNYIADSAGFRASIATNEPGTAPSIPAAASYNTALVRPPTVPTGSLSRPLAHVAAPIYGARVAYTAAPILSKVATATVPVYSAPVAAYASPVRRFSTPDATPRVVIPAARASGPAAPIAPASPLAIPAVATYSTSVAAPVAAKDASPVYAASVAAYAAPRSRVAARDAGHAVPANTQTGPVPSYSSRANAEVANPSPAYAAPIPRGASPTYSTPIATQPAALPVFSNHHVHYSSPVFSHPLSTVPTSPGPIYSNSLAKVHRPVMADSSPARAPPATRHYGSVSPSRGFVSASPVYAEPAHRITRVNLPTRPPPVPKRSFAAPVTKTPSAQTYSVSSASASPNPRVAANPAHTAVPVANYATPVITAPQYLATSVYTAPIAQYIPASIFATHGHSGLHIASSIAAPAIVAHPKGSGTPPSAPGSPESSKIPFVHPAPAEVSSNLTNVETPATAPTAEPIATPEAPVAPSDVPLPSTPPVISEVPASVSTPGPSTDAPAASADENDEENEEEEDIADPRNAPPLLTATAEESPSSLAPAATTSEATTPPTIHTATTTTTTTTEAPSTTESVSTESTSATPAIHGTTTAEFAPPAEAIIRSYSVDPRTITEHSTATVQPGLTNVISINNATETGSAFLYSLRQPSPVRYLVGQNLVAPSPSLAYAAHLVRAPSAFRSYGVHANVGHYTHTPVAHYAMSQHFAFSGNNGPIVYATAPGYIY